MPSDIEIARAAKLTPITAIAARAGIPEEALQSYGCHIAKVGLDYLGKRAGDLDV